MTSPFGRFRKPAYALTADEISKTYGLVIPAVRAHEYDAALELAAPAIGRDTTLLPMIEGVSHLESGPHDSTTRMIGAVFEGRVTIDADGILRQRPPAAELHIGALDAKDAGVAAELATLLTGRGLTTIRSGSVCLNSFQAVAK